MDTRPWKRERIIELPRSHRETEPLHSADGVYCGTCGAFCTTDDAFCGLCGMHLKEGISSPYETLSFGLTDISWQCR